MKPCYLNQGQEQFGAAPKLRALKWTPLALMDSSECFFSLVALAIPRNITITLLCSRLSVEIDDNSHWRCGVR